MGAKVKTPKRPAVSQPDFLTAVELAELLRVADTKTLDKQIAAGDMPPPWLWFGPRKRLWRVDHYRALVATGRWPDEAYKGVRR